MNIDKSRNTISNIEKTNYTYTQSDTTTKYFIVILLLATIFGFNGPSSGQYLQNKLKNAGA
jgi:hypothetical protein